MIDVTGDWADQASAREENQREGAIARVREQVQGGPSRVRCVDCDVEIPVARRKLVHTERCADCQEMYEYLKKRKRHHAT